MSQNYFNNFAGLLKETNPQENFVLEDLYKTKKLVFKLCLNSEMIDCCINNYILFYKDNL